MFKMESRNQDNTPFNNKNTRINQLQTSENRILEITQNNDIFYEIPNEIKDDTVRYYFNANLLKLENEIKILKSIEEKSLENISIIAQKISPSPLSERGKNLNQISGKENIYKAFYLLNDYFGDKEIDLGELKTIHHNLKDIIFKWEKGNFETNQEEKLLFKIPTNPNILNKEDQDHIIQNGIAQVISRKLIEIGKSEKSLPTSRYN